MANAARMSVIALCLLFASPAEVEAKDVDLAKQYFRLGQKLYQRADYAGALKHFLASYENSQHPDLLYNIARCYEALGNPKEAVAYYRRYLSEGKQDSAIIRLRIDNLEKRLRGQRPPVTGPEATAKSALPTTPTPSVAKVAPETKESPHTAASRSTPDAALAPTPPANGERDGSSRLLRISGWTLVGIGTALIGTGAIFGAIASGKASDIEAGAGRGDYYADHASTYEGGQSSEGVAIGTLVAGGIALVSGSGLVLWDIFAPSEARSSATLRILPSFAARQAGIDMTVRF